MAGRAGLSRRSVRWVAVIEWPVEDFVAPGELVLTTGVGCDPARFEQLAREVADSGAAALCVGVGTAAPLAAVPAGVREIGEAAGFPIVELPWEVRFADILRAVVDRLLSARYAAAAPDGDPLPAGLATALLRRDGLTSVAQAVETMLDRPVIMLDAAFAPLTAGPLASERSEMLAAMAERAAAAPAAELRGLRLRLEGEDVLALADLEPLAPSSALIAPAVAQGRVLGYVLALGEGRQANALAVERQALQHAGVAAAIELLRRQAVAQAEARVRGDFIWELAAGELGRQELTAKATLLGYSLQRDYRVLLAHAEGAQAAEAFEELLRQVRRRGDAEGLQATTRAELALILVPVSAPPLLAPARLAERVAGELPRGVVSWGIAEGSYALTELADGLRRARRALRVGRALHGPGTVADATELAPFLMLAGLAEDPEARRAADALLAPLLRYDEGTSRDLLRTLEVFLEENGNTSSAARGLFLNRHSLIYRLRKIEDLTGRDLSSHQDRFIFEVSLRILRLAGGAEPPG